MKNLTKRTDYVYEIEAEGSEDENGGSTVKGILLFKDNGLSLCFDKLYNDKSAAGQTGKWDMLIYEGHQEGKIFNG